MGYEGIVNAKWRRWKTWMFHVEQRAEAVDELAFVPRGTPLLEAAECACFPEGGGNGSLSG
jgi:hypothetical protein